jgi:hypothetical protein
MPSGMMLAGRFSQLPQSERRTGATESSSSPAQLLPTPTSRDSKGSSQGFNDRRDGGLDLPGAIKLLSTPQARDYKGVPADGFNVANLARDVKLLPTPRTTDAQGAGLHGDGGMDLRTAVTLGQDWEQYDAAIIRWEDITGAVAPLPTEPNTTNGKPRLNVEFSEWMMGLPRGWVTEFRSPHRGVGITNTAAFRMVGNGVVPQQAAAAITDLLEGWE